jgi:hypothetical protein
MSRFLQILGSQTIQFTLKLGDGFLISLVIETTRDAVKYIRIIHGKQNHSTIDLVFDLKWINGGGRASRWKILKKIMVGNWNIARLWNIFRLLSAVGTETLAWKLTAAKVAPMRAQPHIQGLLETEKTELWGSKSHFRF